MGPESKDEHAAMVIIPPVWGIARQMTFMATEPAVIT
jgi:hypothetical protein